MGSGAWWVGTYGEVSGFVMYVTRMMTGFLDAINVKIPIVAGGTTYQIPIVSLALSAIFITMVASVFVKGAKG